MYTFSLRQAKLTDGFWAERQRINAESTIKNVYLRFKETGRIDALKCRGDVQTHHFWDSDVAKWIEGAAYLLARKDDAQIRAWYEEAVNDIVSNQCQNGYFNSHFQVQSPDKIFTQRADHELYCAGHLFEAAVATSEYLHDTRLLTFAKKYATYIRLRFIEQRDTGFTTPGHEEIELALWRLFVHTGDTLYKELAEFFLNERGKKEQNDPFAHAPTYSQSHAPIREQTTAQGHAVRALYLYIAMADMAIINRDEPLIQTLKCLFTDMVQQKSYVTGGVGSSHYGERFSVPYDLPPFQAYNETCAGIAFALFCDKMFQLTGESVYADQWERVFYNGVLCGTSLSGDEFFYVNPLEMSVDKVHDNASSCAPEQFPITQRVKVFECSCCPPNVCRFIERIPSFIFYGAEKQLTIAQYTNATLQSELADVTMRANFPYDGKVSISINSHGERVTLRLRKPYWCEKTFSNEKDGYLLYEGIFENETITVDFAPTLRKVYPHPYVSETQGKVCLSFGPLVLCAESIDNPHLRSVCVGDLTQATVDIQNGSPSVLTATLPTVYKHPATTLYAYHKPALENTVLTLIPYFAWANRGEFDMKVWFPEP